MYFLVKIWGKCWKWHGVVEKGPKILESHSKKIYKYIFTSKTTPLKHTPVAPRYAIFIKNPSLNTVKNRKNPILNFTKWISSTLSTNLWLNNFNNRCLCFYNWSVSTTWHNGFHLNKEYYEKVRSYTIVKINIKTLNLKV